MLRLARAVHAMSMVGRLADHHAADRSSPRSGMLPASPAYAHESHITCSHRPTHRRGAALLAGADEAEAMIGINIMRNMTSEHSKSKVCDPEAPSDCRSSRSALLPCALITSTFGD